MPDRSAIRISPVFLVSGLLAFCLLAAFLSVSLLLLRPRFLYQQGIAQINMGRHARAVDFFDKAHAAIPVFLSRTPLTAADRFRLNTNHGKALYEAAIASWKTDGLTLDVHGMFVRSREHLEQAQALENRDYLTAYWRAMAEYALERTHPFLFPETVNPYNADPLFLNAISLRPAATKLRRAYARYLYESGNHGRIPILMISLMSIYPPFYEMLKKEPYYTPALLPYMKQGLENAVKRGVRPRDALNRLAHLYLDQDNPGAAIDAFEKYLAHDPKSNTSGDFYFLAVLCLRDGRFEKSVEAFVQSLGAADDRKKVLRQIYRHFKSLDQFTRFLSFVQHIEDTGLAVPGLDMVKVQCYLDMDQPFLAKKLLERIIAYNPTGQAYFLRATIAQKERDWDAMEINSQRATRLDPYNAGYHFLFARALNYRKKYANAEHAVTQAICYASRESSGYYSFRAWIRWHQGKFKEAARDWDKAAALNPDNPDYALRASQAREKAGLGPALLD